ncbi:unnamed protein product [Bursaphelenchus okinawaensis]|uniref:Uncharacterized protein n=1 Tax=Bursaphelenchus okinawaensis TaxID=465554 RepID=A0A811KTV9_9BILA|nr:unnamed protein product [Bursaphelenchus okinawaensis]CAG9109932.1 unnamed protein product [Bursaphelenchus okinawaensis]
MLTQKERDQIADCYKMTMSIKEVERRTGHSRNTVRRVIRNVPTKQVGRPEKIDAATFRRIRRFVEKEVRAGHKVTAKIIKENLNLGVTRRTINIALKKNGITYEIVKRRLPLSPSHLVCRMNFAKKHLDLKTDFSKCIFTDEKKFSFDGPDNMASYGTPNARLKRIKRQMGGGSVMVLGAICSNGNIKIKVVNGKYKSKDYIKDLKTTFIPWVIEQKGRKGWCWQQDNCTIHTSKETMDFLTKKKVTVVDWPSRSPDLSIIENVWKLLEDRVHQHGQFYDKGTLEQKILERSENFPKDVILNLYSSIPRRLEKVLAAGGDEI